MVSTTEVFNENILMSPGPYVNVKHPSESKSLRQFTELLYVKNKTAVRQLCADKSKRKALISGSMLWSSIPNM